MALNAGKPDYLMAIYDSDGRACGLDKGVKDYPYAYFSRPDPAKTIKEMLSYTLCVKACPTEGALTLDCAATSVNKTQLCTGLVLNKPTAAALTAGSTQTIIYSSALAFDKMCMPGKDLLAAVPTLQSFL